MQPKPNTEQVALRDEPATDLCGTCVNGDKCNLRSTPSIPIHQCNEYDDGTPANTMDIDSSQLSVPVQSAVSTQDALLGLCVNCDHRETCTLRRPVSGVWHCEEYQ